MSINLSSNFNEVTQLPLDARTVVADTTARDAIAAGQRYAGLMVYVTDIAKNYQLQGGILNTNWVEIAESANALQLDQTTPQTVTGGTPNFYLGIEANDGSDIAKYLPKGVYWFDGVTLANSISREYNLLQDKWFLNIKGSEIKLADFTTDGFLKTSNSDGTITVDTNTYLTSVAFADLTDYPADASGVLTNDGSGNLSWGAGGSQTPWTSDIDGGTYDLFNIGGINDNAGTPVLSIDTNNRILYASDGTTPMADWSNSTNGISLFNGNGHLFSDGGSGLHIQTSGTGVLSVYDGISAYLSSVDWGNRILYDSSGIVSQVNWATPGVVYVTNSLNVNNGGFVVNSDDTILTLGAILDSSSLPSVDPTNRTLYASDGTTPALDWANGGRVLVNGATDDTTSALQVSGKSYLADATTYTTFNDGTYAGTFGDLAGSSIVYLGDSAGVAGYFSDNAAGNEVYIANGTNALDITGNVQFTSGNIIDASSNPSIDPNNRYLYDSGGTIIKVDWNNGQMLDASAQYSLDWNAREVEDSSGLPSLHWGNRILYASDGTSTRYDWENNQIFDSSASPGLLSIDPNNRILYAGDGSTAILKWDTINGIYGGASPTSFIDLALGQLTTYPSTTVLPSVDWVNRILYAEDGITEMIEWTSTGVQISNAYTLPTSDGTVGQVLTTDGAGVVTWETVGALGYATTALDNLASVAINTSLISDTNNTDDLGSSSIQWKDIYVDGVGYIDRLDSYTMVDNASITQGTGNDVTIKYTGTNWEFNVAVATTAIVFNEGGLNTDFRVESDGNANMLFVDAGNNRVGIGKAPDYILQVAGGASASVPTIQAYNQNSNTSGQIIQARAGDNLGRNVTAEIYANAALTNFGGATSTATFRGNSAVVLWASGTTDDTGHVIFGSRNSTAGIISGTTSRNWGIGYTDVATTIPEKLSVNGKILAQDKVVFTQTDGNEYIDSLADGFMDYGATTAHRFLANVKLTSDTVKLYLGASDDMSIDYDGTQGNIKTDLIAPSDLHIDCGTDKMPVLDETVWNDVQFAISSGRVGVANFPDWDTTFTTNTAEYKFDVDDYIDLGANEMPHDWKEGTAVYPHLHIALDGANASGSSQYVKFTLYIAYADVNEVWTETSMDIEKEITTGTADLTHLLASNSSMALTNNLIGSQIKIRLKRIAATTGTEYPNHIFVTQLGIHYETDGFGSRTISAK